MPIVTRNLIDLGQQADGSVRVREDHTDTLGVVWMAGPYLAPSLAAAEAIMLARDFTAQLRERDIADVKAHVARGFPNAPATFNYLTPLRDITALDGEEEIAVHFADMIGDEAAPFAWWIQNLNNPQWNAVRNRVGFTSQDGDTIRSRATVILTAAGEYNLTIEDPR